LDDYQEYEEGFNLDIGSVDGEEFDFPEDDQEHGEISDEDKLTDSQKVENKKSLKESDERIKEKYRSDVKTTKGETKEKGENRKSKKRKLEDENDQKSSKKQRTK